MTTTRDDQHTEAFDGSAGSTSYMGAASSSKPEQSVVKFEDEERRGKEEIPVDDDDDFELEEDIFNLWLVSGCKSSSFVFCFLVFVIQVTIILLLFEDVLRDDDRAFGEDDDNPWNIPVYVDRNVAISQCLALIIAVVSQDDVLISLDALISVIYDQQVVEDFGIPNASLCRWRFFNGLRWIEGMMTLIVSLLIVIQTDNVLDIFMNFAAVEFVSNIDNMAYTLASSGFLGGTIKNKTERVKKIKFRRDRSFWKGFLIQTAFLINLFALISIWWITRAQQTQGYYLQKEACNSITVEFGSEVFDLSSRLDGNELPSLLHYSYFSGEYTAVIDKSSRPVYYERGQIDDPKAGKFYYCDAVKSWVFTIPALQEAIPNKGRVSEVRDAVGLVCEEGWLLQSPMTEEFKLEDVDMENWNIIIGSGTIAVTQELRLGCGECSRDSDCSLNGVCNQDTGACECDPGWQGRICSIEEPVCDKLVFINSGASSYEYWEFRPFVLMRDSNGNPLHIYDRPVYTLKVPDDEKYCHDGSESYNYVFLYTGRRWLGSQTCEGEMEMFQKNFHTYWTNYIQQSLRWYSDPTDSETPTGFEWNALETTRSRGNFGLFGYATRLKARFECTDIGCNPNLAIGTCGDLGRCIRTETNTTACACDRLSSGYFCEQPPQAEYVTMQVQLIIALLGNVTGYDEFLQALGEKQSWNEYYLRYFDHQVREYFGRGRTEPGVNSSNYPDPSDAGNIRRMARRITSGERLSTGTVDLRFRL